MCHHLFFGRKLCHYFSFERKLCILTRQTKITEEVSRYQINRPEKKKAGTNKQAEAQNREKIKQNECRGRDTFSEIRAFASLGQRQIRTVDP